MLSRDTSCRNDIAEAVQRINIVFICNANCRPPAEGILYRMQSNTRTSAGEDEIHVSSVSLRSPLDTIYETSDSNNVHFVV